MFILIVVVPRHGAHNWEGPGLLTALTAHKQLSQITNRLAWITEHRSTPNFAVIAGIYCNSYYLKAVDASEF